MVLLGLRLATHNGVVLMSSLCASSHMTDMQVMVRIRVRVRVKVGLG